ncbi:hypothetical protein AMECASPLE_026063 [Ameca splendens]|uniref:Uncharacterized protein n=1 Tax=Ameca splendens TaxID=208324 RepID=A0ABV0ZQU6_9TELE
MVQQNYHLKKKTPSMSWDFPRVTSENRRWLFDKLLFHAVLGKTSRQVQQLRQGLKDTQIWPLLKERTDTAPLLFPRTSDIQFTAQAHSSPIPETSGKRESPLQSPDISCRDDLNFCSSPDTEDTADTVSYTHMPKFTHLPSPSPF